MPETLWGLAPAKVNLTLEVLGKREDGYHDVSTLLQTLELEDEVTLTFAAAPGMTVSGPYAVGTPDDESNLAWKAAHTLASETGRSVADLRIDLMKNVPPAGGLGGGSSDAATVIHLLWKAWPEITTSIAGKACAAVGSDVAALVNGGTVFAYGRGEIVFKQQDLPAHGVVLVVPEETMASKTARMFAALDSLPFDDGSITQALKSRLPCHLRGRDVFNAFERVAFDLFPGLATLWEELEARIGEPIHLAGAGPTLFWIGPVAETEAVAARASGLPCTVIPTRTSPSLWRP